MVYGLFTVRLSYKSQIYLGLQAAIILVAMASEKKIGDYIFQTGRHVQCKGLAGH